MTIGEVKELIESEELQSETQVAVGSLQPLDCLLMIVLQSCGADSLANLREVAAQAVNEWGSYRLVLNEDGDAVHTVCDDEQTLRQIGARSASKLMIVPPSTSGWRIRKAYPCHYSSWQQPCTHSTADLSQGVRGSDRNAHT